MIHCGFVGLLGLPNAGKSSLLNQILDEPVSIVTSKPQTTRQALSGVWTTDEFQLIFFDSPGFVQSQPGLFEFLSSEFKRVVEKSDILLFMVAHDQRPSSELQSVQEKLIKSGKPVYHIFSKVDLPATDFVNGLKEDLRQKGESFFELSLRSPESVSELKKNFSQWAKQLPQEHHPLYDPDMISLDNIRDLVAEYIREACFEKLEKEIPFGLGVIIKSFKEEPKITRIEANIIVEKENHKAIVIGQKGQQLKQIGQKARLRIEKLLDQKVYLGLFVTYKKQWPKNRAIMKEMGYSDVND